MEEEGIEIYYRNDQNFHYEHRKKNRRFHGLCRGWHLNGSRSYEEFFIKGTCIGVSKYYNEDDSIEILRTQRHFNHGIMIKFHYHQTKNKTSW